MSPHHQIHHDQVERIVQVCTRLSFAYARAIDFRDYDALPLLFAEDGRLDVGGALHGREAILESLRRRPDELRSRHVITNVFVDVLGADDARGIAYLTLYRHQGEESLRAGPVALSGPAAVGHYEDRFVRTDQGWLFRSRRLHLAFRDPAAF